MGVGVRCLVVRRNLLGEPADSPTPPTINMTPALHGAVPDTPSPQAVACVSKWEPGFSLIKFWGVSFTID